MSSNDDTSGIFTEADPSLRLVERHGLHLATVDGLVTDEHLEITGVLPDITADVEPPIQLFKEDEPEPFSFYDWSNEDTALPVSLSESSQAQAVPKQEYGQAMRISLNAGQVAVKNVVEHKRYSELLESPEISRLRDEFDTAVNEMIKTAKGVGELVTIERHQTFDTINGQVVAEDGEPFADLISRGTALSRQRAKEADLKMLIQANRDAGDGFLLENYVEPMFYGAKHNTVMAIVAYPKDMEVEYGKKAVAELGYNDEFECAMGQLYFADGDQCHTMIFSIDKSNVTVLANKLRGLGVNVPKGVSPTELIKYPFTGDMTYEQAKKMLKEFVVEYENDAGLPPKLATTAEIAEDLKGLKDRCFETVYLQNAVSLAIGKKTDQLNQFVNSILPVVDTMSSGNKKDILAVAEKEDFTVADARVMHGAILYSLAAEFRSLILAKIPEAKASGQRIQVSSDKSLVIGADQSFIDHMAASFRQGVESGQSFGGCGARFGFGDVENNNPQAAFGGKDRLENKDEDKFGAREFICTKGHKIRRPYNKLVEACPYCHDNGESVRC